MPRSMLLGLMVPVLATGTMLLSAAGSSSSEMSPSEMSPSEALFRLKRGNERFWVNKVKSPHQDAGRRFEVSVGGQHPFATVITCSDSRVPVEILFDQGIGDIFVIRVAGNVCGTDEIGSIEYGVDHLATPVLVVLGHSQCGAVTDVAKGEKVEGNLPALTEKIIPAVNRARQMHPNLEGEAFITEAIRENVWKGIEDLLSHSDVTRKRVRGGKLKIIGAFYDIQSGQVEWLGEHPRQAALMREPLMRA
ncbi:MAG: carbonic anhydrase [Candidatus Sumerlaeia bacterium]